MQSQPHSPIVMGCGLAKHVCITNLHLHPMGAQELNSEVVVVFEPLRRLRQQKFPPVDEQKSTGPINYAGTGEANRLATYIKSRDEFRRQNGHTCDTFAHGDDGGRFEC